MDPDKLSQEKLFIAGAKNIKNQFRLELHHIQAFHQIGDHKREGNPKPLRGGQEQENTNSKRDQEYDPIHPGRASIRL